MITPCLHPSISHILSYFTFPSCISEKQLLLLTQLAHNTTLDGRKTRNYHVPRELSLFIPEMHDSIRTPNDLLTHWPLGEVTPLKLYWRCQYCFKRTAVTFIKVNLQLRFMTIQSHWWFVEDLQYVKMFWDMAHNIKQDQDLQPDGARPLAGTGMSQNYTCFMLSYF